MSSIPWAWTLALVVISLPIAALLFGLQYVIMSISVRRSLNGGLLEAQIRACGARPGRGPVFRSQGTGSEPLVSGLPGARGRFGSDAEGGPN